MACLHFKKKITHMNIIVLPAKKKDNKIKGKEYL
jgi:hypothetical protein